MCARAYHALFMYNMLIRPTPEEMKTFGKPDFTIFNAGAFPVNRYTSYMSSSTSIDLNLRCVTRRPRTSTSQAPCTLLVFPELAFFRMTSWIKLWMSQCHAAPRC